MIGEWSAREYGKAAAELAQLAGELRPVDGDPLANSRNLMIYHLRAAAKIAREMAEYSAARRGLGGPATIDASGDLAAGAGGSRLLV
jgi:hypothetical protein